ncbi:BA75_00514T0 [Komagataella pastoris]|uniref:BA75_00514T0 n=1 Tax=Komagataella pastoris TaxID=4922 RepID=A0A1B2J7H7_PICPA|nr:BA75_00514T0 [Komagataella pastoris]
MMSAMQRCWMSSPRLSDLLAHARGTSSIFFLLVKHVFTSQYSFNPFFMSGLISKWATEDSLAEKARVDDTIRRTKSKSLKQSGKPSKDQGLQSVGDKPKKAKTFTKNEPLVSRWANVKDPALEVKSNKKVAQHESDGDFSKVSHAHYKEPKRQPKREYHRSEAKKEPPSAPPVDLKTNSLAQRLGQVSLEPDNHKKEYVHTPRENKGPKSSESLKSNELAQRLGLVTAPKKKNPKKKTGGYKAPHKRDNKLEKESESEAQEQDFALDETKRQELLELMEQYTSTQIDWADDFDDEL